MNSKGRDERYVRCLTRYLDKHVTVIQSPRGVIRLFAGVKKARHHLELGLRNLLNYLEATGVNKDYLNSLRKALPKIKQYIDVRIPEKREVRILQRAC